MTKILDKVVMEEKHFNIVKSIYDNSLLPNSD